MALRARRKAGCGLTSPINVFDACSSMNLEVRFVDIPSMEGMLVRERGKPRILVSAVRPPGRQAFTCAHELGHLLLGHESVIDEFDLMAESSLANRQQDNDELAADQFASFFLMPKTAVQAALRDRGLKPETCSAQELLMLACWFGVGYTTLLAHLCFGLRLMSQHRYEQLRRKRPQVLREGILGQTCSGLMVVDRLWGRLNIDVRCGDVVWFPYNEVTGPLETFEASAGGQCVSPQLQGVYSITVKGVGTMSIRAMKDGYEGRSIFRYLPDEDDDDGID